MFKLSASDILLLGLATLGDLAENIFIGGGKAYKHSKLLSYFPPGYKKMNLTQNVYRQIKNKYLVIENNQPLLTKKGDSHLKNRFPLAKLQQQSWNQKWCIVGFDIPEKQKQQRNKLRRKLEHIGFAQLQKSIYLSPHPLAKEVVSFIKDVGLSKYSFVLEGKQKHLQVNQEKINKLWNTEEISNSYSKLIKNFNKTNKDFLYRYLKISTQDPHLPYELLPPNWPATKAKKLASTFISHHPS